MHSLYNYRYDLKHARKETNTNNNNNMLLHIVSIGDSINGNNDMQSIINPCL